MSLLLAKILAYLSISPIIYNLVGLYTYLLLNIACFLKALGTYIIYILGKVSFLIYNIIGGKLILLTLSVYYTQNVLNNAVYKVVNDLTRRNILRVIRKNKLILYLKLLNSKLLVLRSNKRKSKVRQDRENDNKDQIKRSKGA